MTQANIALFAGVALLLLVVAIALLLLPNREAERLKQRAAEAATPPGPGRGANDPRRSARLVTYEGDGGWARLGRLMGYDPTLPPPYAPSIPLVLGTSALAGLLVFSQSGWALGGPLSTIAGVGVALGLTNYQFRQKTQHYRRLLFLQMPDMLALVVRSVRAGLPVSDALNAVGVEMPSPTRDEFTRAMGEVSLGVPLEQALWSLYQRTRMREYSFLAVTLGLQAQTGGNLAETLDNLADMVRKRVALEGRARALTAEGRASATILTVMPFLTAGGLALISPGYLDPLFYDPRGANLVIAFVVLLASGLFVINWLIKRSTRD